MTPNIVAAKLPRFLLLHGPRTTCHRFAHEVMSRFDEGMVLDFSAPILASTAALFFNGDFYGMDADDPETYLKWLPIHDSVTVETWINCHISDLRLSLGRDILGRIFVHDYRLNNYEELISSVIIRDYYTTEDATPLVEAYGAESLYCVNLGPLTDNFKLPKGIRVSWIAVPEAPKQVDQLILDLSQPRAVA